jgi:hypothetical protein
MIRNFLPNIQNSILTLKVSEVSDLVIYALKLILIHDAHISID